MPDCLRCGSPRSSATVPAASHRHQLLHQQRREGAPPAPSRVAFVRAAGVPIRAASVLGQRADPAFAAGQAGGIVPQDAGDAVHEAPSRPGGPVSAAATRGYSPVDSRRLSSILSPPSRGEGIEKRMRGDKSHRGSARPAALPRLSVSGGLCPAEDIGLIQLTVSRDQTHRWTGHSARATLKSAMTRRGSTVT
jgi:hypothetical protein